MEGSELRRIRKHLNLSPDAFAIELGYDGNPDGNRATIRRFEGGKRDIPPPVARLAHMLFLHGLPEWPHSSQKSEVPHE